jgi:hypothetical protein
MSGSVNRGALRAIGDESYVKAVVAATLRAAALPRDACFSTGGKCLLTVPG